MGPTVNKHAAAEYGEQFVWVDQIGYVRIRNLVRGVTIAYVLLTAVVTILTSDLLTVVFLGLCALVVLRVISTNQLVSPNRRVNVYTEDGFYIAAHVGSGRYRHGVTQSDALAKLDVL